MRASQSLAVEGATLRGRLNELILKEEPLSAEERTELDAGRDRLTEVEKRYAAALAAEGSEVDETETDSGDGESAEFRALDSKVSLGRYLMAAAAGAALSGAELEYAQACGIEQRSAGVQVPWQAIAPREERDDTATSVAAAEPVPRMLDPILRRVFKGSVMELLGVEAVGVPAGEKSYLALTAGASAQVVAAGARVDAEAATVAKAATLEPHRVGARYLFRQEDELRLGPDLESSLRGDLSGVLQEGIASVVVNGSGDVIDGFLDTLAAPAPAGAEVAAVDDFLASVAGGVDGVWAAMSSQVRLLVGPDTYRLAAGKVVSGTDSTAASVVARESGGFMASALLPGVANHVQEGIRFSDGRMERTAVLATWAGVTLLRDPYTRAAEGEVALTATAFVDFAVLRSAPYSRVQFRTSK